MTIDAATIFVIIASVIAGVVGGRRTASQGWQELFNVERARGEQDKERITELVAQTTQLTSDLASLRARPDMTRLAGMIDAHDQRSSAASERILESQEKLLEIADGVAHILRSIQTDLEKRRREYG